MIELLAPAGDLEKLKFALSYGADAVYIGGQNYSLRANAKNFTLENLKEGVEFAHSIHKKVYVTVNIILHEEEDAGLIDYLISLSQIGVDAVIVSDIYIVKKIQDLKIPLEVHLSTQASVLNPYSAKFYQKLGVKRIVLAREASKDDIKAIKEETGLELECFIHGAMCTSISGRCVLSNALTNRDANRGGCAQICRWTFDANGSTFSITSKDLNMIPHIKEMISLGVNSFKVEGRMRGIYYIATVILTYRRLIDKILDNTLTEEETEYSLKILNRCANRDSTPQFFNGLPTEKEQYFLENNDEPSNQDFLGLVLDYEKEEHLAKIEQRNYFKVGDIVEFFGPHLETFSYQIHTILNEKKETIAIANHPREVVYLKIDTPLEKDAMMRIKIFDKPEIL